MPVFADIFMFPLSDGEDLTDKFEDIAMITLGKPFKVVPYNPAEFTLGARDAVASLLLDVPMPADKAAFIKFMMTKRQEDINKVVAKAEEDDVIFIINGPNYWYHIWVSGINNQILSSLHERIF